MQVRSGMMTTLPRRISNGQSGIKLLAFTLVSVVSMSSFASATPQSVADCQKIHAHDKAKIQACIVGLKK